MNTEAPTTLCHCAEENSDHWQLRRSSVVSLTLMFARSLRLSMWQKLERKQMSFGFTDLGSEFRLGCLLVVQTQARAFASLSLSFLTPKQGK